MTINELRKKCYELELEGKEILDKYTDEDLEKIYNGIGPDRFPDWLREIVTESAELFEPAALIHDVEYDEGGTKEQFAEANERFRRNCYAVVKERFAWYDIRRYLWMNRARRWSNYCQLFGWEGWTKKRKEKKVMTKRKIFNEKVALCTAGLLLMSAGCLSTDQRENVKKTVHLSIIKYVEEEGQEKAIEYIDKLVEEGKLGSANAGKIKEAIHAGIDRLRNVMCELEKESQENE